MKLFRYVFVYLDFDFEIYKCFLSLRLRNILNMILLIDKQLNIEALKGLGQAVLRIIR